MNFNWKDIYYDQNGNVIDETYNPEEINYVSMLGTNTTKQTSTRDNPFGIAKGGTITTIGANSQVILSSGFFSNLNFIQPGGARNTHWQGQGIDHTIAKITHSVGYSPKNNTLKNMTIISFSVSEGIYHFYNCRILGNIPHGSGQNTNSKVYYSIIDGYDLPSNVPSTRNTFQNLTIVNYSNRSLEIYKNCQMYMNQPVLDSYKGIYFAFDNCSFKLGTETDFSPLLPTDENGQKVSNPTELQFRNEFNRRCVAAGLNPPAITEYGETLVMGKWVFSNNSSINGLVYENSIIAKFQERKFIKFGRYDQAISEIYIKDDQTIPNSFNIDYKDDKLIIENDKIHISPDIEINTPQRLNIDSKIIYLDGLHNISSIDILNNLPIEYGVYIDSTSSLSDAIESDTIESGKTYLVRSTNENLASVIYNGITYTSSLNARINLFRGIQGINSFSDINGNAVVYEVLDYALHHTFQMRVVNQIPDEKIITGNLYTNYWYFVAPNDLNDTSGSIQYKGIDYPCYSSFIASDTSSISVNGQCHLRRCWHKDFNFDTETIDKVFWQEIQKPKWCDIVPNDLRCLKKNNSEYSIEMATDNNGGYITTGHPDFYNYATGENGIKMQTFQLSGTFIQLRLIINTLNPM